MSWIFCDKITHFVTKCSHQRVPAKLCFIFWNFVLFVCWFGCFFNCFLFSHLVCDNLPCFGFCWRPNKLMITWSLFFFKPRNEINGPWTGLKESVLKGRLRSIVTVTFCSIAMKTIQKCDEGNQFNSWFVIRAQFLSHYSPLFKLNWSLYRIVRLVNWTSQIENKFGFLWLFYNQLL